MATNNQVTNSPRANQQAASSQVTSNQLEPYTKLAAVVTKHQLNEFQKPLADFNRAAFAQAQNLWHQHGGALILDSGCGIGQSTHLLAQQFPHHFVLGVDRSEQRLERNLTPRFGALPANAALLRADLVDFWRLAVQAGWRPERHYLLYPNPYPKKQDFKQRWHGHPVFKYLVALGGRLECRTNWHIYAQELKHALELQQQPANLQPLASSTTYLTPFERKYAQSGHQLWQVVAHLS